MPKGRLGLRGTCKPCEARRNVARKHGKDAPRCAACNDILIGRGTNVTVICQPCRDMRREQGFHWCAGHQGFRPVADFTLRSGERSGLSVRCRDCDKADYQENREEIIARALAWNKSNPVRVKVNGARVTARRFGSPVNTLSEADVNVIMGALDGHCLYCLLEGRETAWEELDHIRPLCLGGENAIGNVVLACHECNYKKRKRDGTSVHINRKGLETKHRNGAYGIRSHPAT